MRKIKFRVWDIDNKCWYHSTQLVIRPYSGSVTDGATTPNVELMQYTGLCDNDGKEIYEGDIVEIQNTNETKTSFKSPVFSTFHGMSVNPHPAHSAIGLGNIRSLADFCDYGIGYQFHLKCKVVGNIYENPELLNSK